MEAAAVEEAAEPVGALSLSVGPVELVEQEAPVGLAGPVGAYPLGVAAAAVEAVAAEEVVVVLGYKV